MLLNEQASFDQTKLETEKEDTEMTRRFKSCSIKVGILGLFFIASATISADASCVVNNTEYTVFIEYYGTWVKEPTFDRGGKWVEPGERLCLAGQGGDWLVLPLNWMGGKPSDWQLREGNRLGGTKNQPRGFPIYVSVAQNGQAEVQSFEAWQDNRGWWVRPVCKTSGDNVFTIEISNAEDDYVFVNDTRENRHIRSLRAGSASVPLNGSMKDGFNTVEIWKKRPGFNLVGRGTGYVLKRDGRPVLTIPGARSAVGPNFPGWKEVVRISVNRTTGEAFIYRGWGLVNTCNGNSLVKAGWQSGEAFMRSQPCPRIQI